MLKSFLVLLPSHFSPCLLLQVLLFSAKKEVKGSFFTHFFLTKTSFTVTVPHIGVDLSYI